MLKRVILFLLTNLAVIFLLNITMRLLGIDSFMATSSAGVNLQGLLVFAAVIGFGGSFISLAMSKWSAKWMTGAKVITAAQGSTERWLLSIVSAQAERAGIGMPDVAIYESNDINAFATGMSKNNSLVAVSSGLLDRMSQDEVEAVLAHEISHIANGDMVTLALIQGVVNTFVIFLSRIIGHLVDRALSGGRSRGYGLGFWITTIVSEIILGVLASIIVMWFSRRREYRADFGGARLAGKQKMIAALRKLQSAHEPSNLPDQIKAFGISGKAQGITGLFMSHPPLSERIKALEETII
ncbi:MAG: protease HtpX [Burkholderiales bacterium]